MPREPRYFEPGVLYHLISRIVERKFLISKPLYRSTYLEMHRKALAHTDWNPLGFAIMSNHIHWAAIAGRLSLDTWLRPVHSPFADLLNKEADRIGPVFVRGPKAFAVPNERAGHLLAYIHNNPVRAGVVDAAIDSNWTSHRAYVGREEAPPWLDISRGLALARVKREDFDAWVNAPVQRADTSYSEEAHERELQLADDECQSRAASDESAFAVVQAIAGVLEIPTSQVLGGSRGSQELTARAAAAHCSKLLGLPAERIASALNLSRQRVSLLRRQQPADDVLEIAARVYRQLTQP